MLRFIIDNSFIFLILFLLAGAFGALLFAKNKNLSNMFACASASVASIFGIIAALNVILTGKSLILSMPELIPYFTINFIVDNLAAYFILVISTIAIAASIYAIEYAKEYFEKYNIGILGFLYNLFVLSLFLVVSAGNIFWFLIVWELMSVSSYFLVIYEYDKKENQKAGFLYFIMTHIGAALITLAFLILYKYSGSLDFTDMNNIGGAIPDAAKNAIFLLAFLGFGSKAGIIPLHIWLPAAHPAAPSHVSSLMSGVMLKIAIYGFIRVIFSFLGASVLWWGILVIIVATVSAILGVLYALTEHDIKRLLAFHSVENIGIILIGVGGAMIFSSLELNSLAAIALIGGLFHVFNHAIFKGLLFLGAGSVIKSTHTRNMEDLGGLIKSMPYTALFFLIGAISISALPPFNGFASEWLVFQSLFASIAISELSLKILFAIIIAVLALTSALAAACFVKAFSITFLANPRSHHAENVTEAGWPIKTAMGLLAALCITFGIYPFPIINLLNGISGELLQNPIIPNITDSNTLFITPFQNGFSSFSPIWIAILILGIIPIAFILEKILGGKLKKRVYGTWDCGSTLNPRMQYTATAFSKPIQMIFKNIYRSYEKVETNYYNDGTKYFMKQMKYEVELNEVYEKYLYSPIANTIVFLSKKMLHIQYGNVNIYLLYIFITLIVLLMFFK